MDPWKCQAAAPDCWFQVASWASATEGTITCTSISVGWGLLPHPHLHRLKVLHPVMSLSPPETTRVTVWNIRSYDASALQVKAGAGTLYIETKAEPQLWSAAPDSLPWARAGPAVRPGMHVRNLAAFMFSAWERAASAKSWLLDRSISLCRVRTYPVPSASCPRRWHIFADTVDRPSQCRLEQHFVHALARHPREHPHISGVRSLGDSMAQIRPNRVGLGLQKSRPFIIPKTVSR